MTAPSKAHRTENTPAGPPEVGPPTRAQLQAQADAARLLEPLTPRELQVLARLATGDDDRAVAAALGMAPATARRHLQRAMRKLGVESREDAARLAALLGIPPDAAAPDTAAPDTTVPEAAAVPPAPPAPPVPPVPPVPPAEPAFATFSAAVHPRLVQQVYLLTGSVQRADHAVRTALGTAALEWEEVAALDDPEARVRAAAFEAAQSPWHRLPRLRPRRRRDRPAADGTLLAALDGLTRPRRRALVLHDAVGLPVPALAAEVESTTAAAEARVRAARAQLARTVPEVVGDDPLAPGFGPALGGLLYEAAVRACPARQAPAADRLETGARRRSLALTAAAGLLTLAMGGAVVTTMVLDDGPAGSQAGGPAPAAKPDTAVAPPPQVCSAAGTGSAGPAAPGHEPGLHSPWCSPVPPQPAEADGSPGGGEDG